MSADLYRDKAAELLARSRLEPNLYYRRELQHLAMSYLLLAEQAERNSKTDLVYATPPPSHAPVQQQQQRQSATQQPQPRPEDKT